jgi:hypothetical protein
MIRDGYLAAYRGAEFEAHPDDAEVRLYSMDPSAQGQGFEPLPGRRFRKVVPLTELDGAWYVFTLCTWRGVPCRVLYEQGSHLRVEYVGGQAPVAERIGFELFDRGVYQAWAPRNEAQDLRELRVNL